MFLEVTGPGGSSKSVMASIATLLAGKDNTTSATIDTLESSRERASVVGFSLIILPDQEKWSGDGAGIKAITGGDAVAIYPKYRDAYSTHVPAVILAVNNNPMRFSDRSGGVSRRRVILTFPEVIPVKERDPQLLDKISSELAVIVRHLMQRFSLPDEARTLLQAQQTSGEALEIKGQADPLVDFCGYLMPLSTPNGLFIGNANYSPAESEALSLSCLPVIHGVTRPSAPAQPDCIRSGSAADAEGVRASAPQTTNKQWHTDQPHAT